jgi:hypothetical protein
MAALEAAMEEGWFGLRKMDGPWRETFGYGHHVDGWSRAQPCFSQRPLSDWRQ